MLRRQTAAEFPDTRPGQVSEAIKTRIGTIRQRRQQVKEPASPPPATTAEQLKQLAELREQNALTADQYEAAKSELLHR